MKKLCVILSVVLLLGCLACPAYATTETEVVTDAVIVPAADAMLDFFPALFESITSIFECEPMLYLFSIFILAFVILIFRTITGL